MSQSYVSMKIPKSSHDRLLIMQKTLSSQARGRSPAVVTVTIGSVVDAALDALEAGLDSARQGVSK